MADKNRRINEHLLEGVALEMFSGDELQQLQEDGLRVEYILLDLVRPDPV